MTSPLDRRPLLVVIAGPNGAGKSTFFDAHIAQVGLRFVNADTIARETGLGALEARDVATAVRSELVRTRESFAFETVFSDPVRDKLGFFESAQASGYTVVLCFIFVSSVRISEQRVAMRVSQGGHDVPPEKLRARHPRTLENLRQAAGCIGHVWIFDNDDLRAPFRRVAVFEDGKLVFRATRIARVLARSGLFGR